VTRFRKYLVNVVSDLSPPVYYLAIDRFWRFPVWEGKAGPGAPIRWRGHIREVLRGTVSLRICLCFLGERFQDWLREQCFDS
jgi:hypothetical protein